jgi:hypothetical protein
MFDLFRNRTNISENSSLLQSVRVPLCLCRDVTRICRLICLSKVFVGTRNIYIHSRSLKVSNYDALLCVKLFF